MLGPTGRTTSPPRANTTSPALLLHRSKIKMFHAPYAINQCHRQRHLLPQCFSHSVATMILVLMLSTMRSSASDSLHQIKDDHGHGPGNELMEEPSSPFRIVIDVGSTGSRLHIFELVATTNVANSSSGDSVSPSDESTTDSDGTRTECLRRGSSKAWTPLSAFASPSADDNGSSNDSNDTEDQPKKSLNVTHVAHHMLPLFDYASIIIPSEFHPYTPVRIAATAGMRLLPSEEQARVYDALHEGLSQQIAHGRFVFTDLRREDVMTLDGEREGFYGAVAANYLRGVVDAELRVIVPADEYDDDDENYVGNGDVQTDPAGSDDTDDQGICTNKFGMCEQDAEDIVFGPSHHYIAQNMHDVKRHGPLGALDMGGSSTQIVYRHTVDGDGRYRTLGANDSTEGGMDMLADNDTTEKDYDVPSHLNDKEFFSTSYLSYGADQFRERLWDLWVSETEKNSHGENSPSVIFNPCSFVGYQMNYRGYTLLGTGNAISCTDQINRLIPHHDNAIDLDELYPWLYDENTESLMSDSDQQEQAMKRKMVGGVEHPPLRGKFYGMSLYFFTLDCLRELSDNDHPIHVSWPTPSIEELTHALDAFCARKWQGDLEEVQHEVHEHTRAEVLPHRCVEAVYMVTLLRDGFGFHPSSRDITFTQWVEGNEVEWSLGMALSEFAAEKGRRRDSKRGVEVL